MEEYKIEKELLCTQFYCQNNKEITHICFNSKCKNPSFICGNLQCKCTVNKHDDCQIMQFKRFINRILNKKQSLPKKLIKGFDTLDKIYTEMIDKLSLDKQELDLVKENFGLSTDQAKFLEYIKNKQLSAIDGNLISKIKQKINQSCDLSLLNQENIKQYWNNSNKKFISLAEDLKLLFTDKEYFKPKTFKWDKQSQKNGFKIYENKISKVKSERNNLNTLLQPSICFEKNNICGIKFNYLTDKMISSIGICHEDMLSSETTTGGYVTYTTAIYNSFQKSIFKSKLLSNGFFENVNGETQPCFKFKTGDTIYIMYDSLTSQLKFCKNENDQFFKIKIEDKYKCDKIFIYLNGLDMGCEAQLVKQIPYINWNKEIYIQKIVPLSQIYSPPSPRGVYPAYQTTAYSVQNPQKYHVGYH